MLIYLAMHTSAPPWTRTRDRPGRCWRSRSTSAIGYPTAQSDTPRPGQPSTRTFGVNSSSAAHRNRDALDALGTPSQTGDVR